MYALKTLYCGYRGAQIQRRVSLDDSAVPGRSSVLQERRRVQQYRGMFSRPSLV